MKKFIDDGVDKYNRLNMYVFIKNNFPDLEKLREILAKHQRFEKGDSLAIMFDKEYKSNRYEIERFFDIHIHWSRTYKILGFSKREELQKINDKWVKLALKFRKNIYFKKVNDYQKINIIFEGD